MRTGARLLPGPHVQLDFVVRTPYLAEGQEVQLSAVANFADEADVNLPPSYLAWSSTSPTVASVDSAGILTAHAFGTGAVVVSRNDIQAATSFMVNLPPGEADGLLALLS